MIESEKERLIEKARKLGHHYLARYKGCAQTTLLAVADTLGMEVDDNLFKAMIGLSGQAGGCGGICGAAAAIGLRYDIKRGEFERNPEVRFKVYEVVKRVRDKFIKEYDSYVCKDIQKKLFGRTFDSTIPQDQKTFEKAGLTKECSKVTEKAAGWAVTAILETE